MVISPHDEWLREIEYERLIQESINSRAEYLIAQGVPFTDAHKQAIKEYEEAHGGQHERD